MLQSLTAIGAARGGAVAHPVDLSAVTHEFSEQCDRFDRDTSMAPTVADLAMINRAFAARAAEYAHVVAHGSDAGTMQRIGPDLNDFLAAAHDHAQNDAGSPDERLVRISSTGADLDCIAHRILLASDIPGGSVAAAAAGAERTVDGWNNWLKELSERKKMHDVAGQSTDGIVSAAADLRKKENAVRASAFVTVGALAATFFTWQATTQGLALVVGGACAAACAGVMVWLGRRRDNALKTLSAAGAAREAEQVRATLVGRRIEQATACLHEAEQTQAVVSVANRVNQPAPPIVLTQDEETVTLGSVRIPKRLVAKSVL